MVGDVDEAEIVLDERREQDGRAHEGSGEGRHDSVLRRLREPLAPLPGGNRAGDHGIKGQPEAHDERCAPELGHYDSFLDEYFEGHFVTSVPGEPTKMPPRSRPFREMSRPTLNMSGTEPV